MEKKLVKIAEAAAILGSMPVALRKWEATGELLPARKTKGGTRYYSMADLTAIGDAHAPTERQATAAVIAEDLGLYHADSQQDRVAADA
ncbi:MerR family DNA-binding transcriptional regulator [uncultured Thiodictyon sp.]|uniref:MerR family DNA-binding transcriptional regulator n=1 Tax=uncultured Thiodictyon sp. TaxID=1846217 RepID=UPI0025E9CA81|nr:MerR family DNA-binding transcriptional regulator [uncultured Thiodictyon sp.]